MINAFVAAVDETILPEYLSVMYRFDHWALDGLPTQTYGASDASAPANLEPDPDNDVVLTSVERLAFKVDPARVQQSRVRSMAVKVAFTAAGVVEVIDGVSPFKRLDTDAQRVASIVWCAKRLQTLSERDAARLPSKRLERLLSATRNLQDALLDAAAPSTAMSSTMTCSNHRAAGAIEAVDPHRYPAGLCRWCGDFKRRHAVVPPPVLVRMHDRGVRVGHSMIRRAGVHVPENL